MKYVLKFTITLSIILLLLIPKTSFGLAGFSEQNFEYDYTSNILINFSVPSDSCSPDYDKSQNCIEIYQNQTDEYNSHIQYKSLDLMKEVDFPQTSDPTDIIAQSYRDKTWFIFDLKNDKVVLDDKSYDIVEQKWEKLGNSKPELVNTDNFQKYFHNQTPESKSENDEMEKFARGILLTGLGLLIVVIGGIFGLVYLIKYLSKKKSS